MRSISTKRALRRESFVTDLHLNSKPDFVIGVVNWNAGQVCVPALPP